MTQVTLASKDATPQVLGPFRVVLADVPEAADIATAPALFTTNEGDVVLTMWCKVAVAGTASDSHLNIYEDNVDQHGGSFIPVPAEFPSLLDSTHGYVAQGDPVRAVRSDGDPAFVDGEVDVFLLVLPSPTA